MEADSPREEEEPPKVAVFALPSAQMLPAICPACGAPGTRAEAVLDESGEDDAELDAFYCDLCADDRNSRTTRALAWFAACTLFVVSITTAAALFWGTRELVLQLAITGALAFLLPEVAQRFGLWRAPERLIWLERKEERQLACTSPSMMRALADHDLKQIDERPHAPVRFIGRFRTHLILGAIALVWFGAVQSLGGAQVRVVVAGREKVILLVDQRHLGAVAPTNAEDPRAGENIRVLGGRRRFGLISSSGALLGGATKTIWPGRTYIVGQLPPGECLFWETRRYGDQGRPSLLFPVGGEGPVWELREDVDSWFIPLEAPGSSGGRDERDWATSGGVRRAIRLLPCRTRAER